MPTDLDRGQQAPSTVFADSPRRQLQERRDLSDGQHVVRLRGLPLRLTVSHFRGIEPARDGLGIADVGEGQLLGHRGFRAKIRAKLAKQKSSGYANRSWLEA